MTGTDFDIPADTAKVVEALLKQLLEINHD